MVTPAVRREAVAQVRVAFEVSERRACSALGVDRPSVRYRSRRPDDAQLRARLRELAVERRRFGYRRLHVLMTWAGLHMNHKKLRRLYREEGLQVRRRAGRRRALGTRASIAIPQGQRLKSTWDSTHRWMKVGAQVSFSGHRDHAPVRFHRIFLFGAVSGTSPRSSRQFFPLKDGKDDLVVNL